MDYMPDEEFIRRVYQVFLDREPDEAGKLTYTRQLRDGLSRLQLIKAVVHSSECINRIAKQACFPQPLPDLRKMHPDRFGLATMVGEQAGAAVYKIRDGSDFDWLAEQLRDVAYYDRVIDWSRTITLEHQLLAEIVTAFQPKSVLEIGCSTGRVLTLLHRQGLSICGVEQHHLAIALALQEVRARIVFGDIDQIASSSRFDLIYAVGSFDRVNPNSVEQQLNHLRDLLNRHGFAFVTVSAFGEDSVFGTVYPKYLKEWSTAIKQEGLFSHVHVDERGWPMDGRLTWATPQWWQRQFESSGFYRQPAIERALHATYDMHLKHSCPGRASFFVFAVEPPEKHAERLAHIQNRVSPLLISRWSQTTGSSERSTYP